jgi:ferritin-like metal-binding protein YciE
MADQTVRDLKLVQYLNEAYGKEKQLETALQTHIGMTTKAPYKKRLQQHLKETKAHARNVERRIKQLGGKAEATPAPGPIGDAASAVTSAASKAVSAAKGPLHAIRGTGENEKMLKNAKTEFWNEHEEIATYTAIETLADTVGDKDTAKLAREIRREEERMAKFLAGQIPTLTKAVAREEIPAAERNGGGTRRRRTASGRSRSRSGARSSSSSRPSGTRSRSSSSSRSSATRSRSSTTRSRSSNGPSSSGSRATRARSGSRS